MGSPGQKGDPLGKNQHVVPHGGKWAVRPDNSKRVGSIHPTQGEAIETAIPRAQREHSEVVIHRPDGTIRDKNSYGNDPCPPKDKD